MSNKQLFTSFDGRIGRKRFWRGYLAIIGIALLVSMGIPSLAISHPGSEHLAALILSLAILYPAAAISVKRLHDRDKSGWLAALFLVPGPFLQILELLGIAGGLARAPGAALLPHVISWVLTALIIVAGIWALIELGFCKGTTGPNRYGPDPVEPSGLVAARA